MRTLNVACTEDINLQFHVAKNEGEYWRIKLASNPFLNMRVAIFLWDLKSNYHIRSALIKNTTCMTIVGLGQIDSNESIRRFARERYQYLLDLEQ